MSGELRSVQRDKACGICDDTEPVHVHHNGQRIEDYFVVGRGETDFDAARRWKDRAVRASPPPDDGLRARALTAVVEWCRRYNGPFTYEEQHDFTRMVFDPIALSATPSAQPEGLDVERLARALRAHYAPDAPPNRSDIYKADARDIAREYAVLALAAEEETP